MPKIEGQPSQTNIEKKTEKQPDEKESSPGLKALIGAARATRNITTQKEIDTLWEKIQTNLAEDEDPSTTSE